jgi:hypothetical protein
MLQVRKYRELHIDKPEGVFEQMIHLVSVVNDIDPIEVQHWKGKDLILSFQKAQQFTNITERYAPSLIIGGLSLSLIDFKYLTLGQFIDLEAFVSEDYITNIHKIAATIYLHSEVSGMYENTIEEYAKINIGYRAELIDELPIQSIFGACNKYLIFRKNFFNSYELFSDPYADVNLEDLSEEELEEYNAHLKEQEKQGDNQWETVLNILAQNDITKFESVLKQNLFLCFNQISYLKRNS